MVNGGRLWYMEGVRINSSSVKGNYGEAVDIVMV